MMALPAAGSSSPIASGHGRASGHAGVRRVPHPPAAARHPGDDAGARRRVCGVDAIRALVSNRAVLGLVLPVPMGALVMLTADPWVMGDFADWRVINLAAIAATVSVAGLDPLPCLAADRFRRARSGGTAL